MSNEKQNSAQFVMESFFTKAKAEQGRKLPLYTPTSEKTDHWLNVLGIDSDAFKQAEAEAKRQAIHIAEIEDKKEQFQAQRAVERKLIAALITDWSFDMPCTEENVVNFLTQAPQIEDAVNRFAAMRTTFFA